MNRFISLLRIQQWYKNLVVYLALFFTNNTLDPTLFIKTTLGFLSLSLISSSYYIINDIRDREEDRLHPEKKNRVIASGEVGAGTGYLVSTILFFTSLILAYNLKPLFALFPLVLFISSNLYTFHLKNIAIVDIHVIALNFLLRAVSGAVLIRVPTSPWLITTVFFMAMFLGVAKRKAELAVLGSDAPKHRSVYLIYNERLLSKLLIIIVSALLFTYSIYTFMAHEKPYMMITIPFATFLIFRYLYFVSVDHEIARKTEYVFRDRQMLLGLIMWVITSFLVMQVV